MCLYEAPKKNAEKNADFKNFRSKMSSTSKYKLGRCTWVNDLV